MTRYGGLGRTRPKKLTSKASIPIIQEHEIDVLDDELQTTLQQIETGVEKAEESEFHLQVAINATAQGKGNAAQIPTPETILSTLQYDELFPPYFSQPATFIRFSSTVEDCCRCPYNMNEDDDVFLKIYNQKRDASSQCSEDDFEATMNFFEETAQAKQPYAAVDSPPVLPFSEMQEAMDAAVEDCVKRYAKDFYEHWKSRRSVEGNQNQTLEPSLKFETGQDTDDSDPYVCFRRREVRQIRKTRGRDAQSAEKLRRLRKELEDARQMVALVRQREVARKEMLSTDRLLFLQRAEVRDMKRKLNIKDDDEDLINQKPKKKLDMPSGRPNAPQLRMPMKPGLQGAEDLQSLEDMQAEKENEILRDIKANITKHIKWNEGYVDHTRAPLSPSPERTFDAAAFRPAFTAQLPTPPSSESSADAMDTSVDVTNPLFSREKLASRAMELHGEPHRMPSFRRRMGRGGRLMIDRRNFARFNVEMDPLKVDRFKYDQEDSDEEPVYDTDAYSIQIMQHRAIAMVKAREQAAAAQAHAQAQAQAAQVRRMQGEQPGNIGNPHPGVVASGEA
ncbi:Enhancer of polycomb-like protein 1 [Penicillium taxi]|uniref:Enhancer of polycomb-like protein 1 n=1 Tax=Penicillium taxi TaxID=168475 RepID=UPI0025456CED|nr:Enhancer of polycomb-like protein 1 [Penicillium taxi]KAJ5902527.1 Enhancer of polycomb-like protein 1 [Penicillium taxi]